MNGILFIVAGALLCFKPALSRQIEFLTPKMMDLGRVREGTVVKDSIRFINKDSSPIRIHRVQTSCGCTAAQIEKTELAPGDTATILFSLSTSGFQGVIRKSVTVYFEGANIKTERIVLEATVYSEFDVTPRYIHLKRTVFYPDSIFTAFLFIQNHSSGPIHCTKIYAKSDFIHISPSSAVIQAGEKKSLTVELKPTRAGRNTSYIIIESDYEPNPIIHIPVFIDIKND